MSRPGRKQQRLILTNTLKIWFATYVEEITQSPFVNNGVNNQILDNQSNNQDIKNFVLKNPFAIVALLLIILTLLLFFLHQYFFASPFKILANLNYDSSNAVSLIKDSATIALSRNNGLFINNFKGKEMILFPFKKEDPMYKNIAQLKLSKSRHYITFQTDTGIMGLNIDKKQVFLIYESKQRQIYDLSPLQDKILLLINNQLVEIDLDNGITHSVLTTLPKLDNLHQFNYATYSPNGSYIYIRSLHKGKSLASENIVINLKTNQVSIFSLDDINHFSLLPIWYDNQSLLIQKEGLSVISSKDNTLKTIVFPKNFDYIGAYALNNKKDITYIAREVSSETFSSQNYTSTKSASLKKLRQFKPMAIYLFNSQSSTNKTLISSDEKRLNNLKNQQGFIVDVSWLDNDTILFTVVYGPSEKALWKLNIKNKLAELMLNNFNQNSLDDVFHPYVGED